MNESDLTASYFIDCMNDCFMHQNVLLPTFQVSFGSESNLLDLILSENGNRINCLEHLPPLGGISHGHHVLRFNYSFKDERINGKSQIKQKLLFKRGNYSELSEYFSSFNWEKEFQDLDANECYKKWLKVYHLGCDKLIPRLKLKYYKKHSPWMSNDLREIVKLKKSLWYKCRHSGFKQYQNVEEYKSLNKTVKKKVARDIKAFELNLAKNSKNNPKSVYAYLNSKTVIKDTVKALKSVDDSITTNGIDIANSLNEYFVSVFLKDESLEDVSFSNKCENVCKDPSFEVDDVHEQLINLNVNKSFGVDKVHPHVLKECSDSLSQPLSLIFKKSFYSGVVPDEWLVANITPLFKKGNKLEPTNYRPVSLTSIVCKIMEK
jgi:hypothetical protein